MLYGVYSHQDGEFFFFVVLRAAAEKKAESAVKIAFRHVYFVVPHFFFSVPRIFLFFFAIGTECVNTCV